LFKSILQQMNAKFYHSTVTGKQVEQFWIEKTGMNYGPLFDQYLRTTQIPTVEWRLKNKTLQVRLTNCVPEFWLNLWIPTADGQGVWRNVHHNKWTTQSSTLSAETTDALWLKDYYVTYKAVSLAEVRKSKAKTIEVIKH
ncbi:MAG: hypothetical protein EAY75_00875, partial [Bacteroidetes bacterium]